MSLPDSPTRPLGTVAVVAYTEYPTDGRVRAECETLAGLGYRVIVVSAALDETVNAPHTKGIDVSTVPITIQRGGPLRYCYQYAMFLLLSTVALARISRQTRVSVVHVHSLPDFQVFSAALHRLIGVPVLLDLHEALPEIVAARFRLESGSVLVKLASAAEQISCQFASHVIVANDGIRDALTRRGMPRNRVTAVYNTATGPATIESRDVASMQALLPQGRLIVHAGGINPERDLETVLRAMALIPGDFEVALGIAGVGNRDYIASLLALSRSLGLGDRVRYIGKRTPSEARAAMSLAYVGLVALENNPLTRLAWPTRIVEMARLGKPLLVPNLPFIRRTLADAAVYYEPGDPKSLATSLQAIANDTIGNEQRIARANRVCDKLEQFGPRFRLPDLYRALTSDSPG